MKNNKINAYLAGLMVYYEALRQKFSRFFFNKKDPYLPLPEGMFLSPSEDIISSYKKTRRKLSFLNYTKSPYDWKKKARKKLITISGYFEKRFDPIISSISNEVTIDDDIYKLTLYLKVREKSHLPVHLIYEES